MSEIIVVLDNVRSLYNVGSILRTCDGMGVKTLFACGTTPYPETEDDERLPHVRRRADKQIAKTALGAEQSVKIKYFEQTLDAISQLRQSDFNIWAIEQTANSVDLNAITTIPNKLAVVFGNEVDGVDETIIFDKAIQLKMKGSKESFNVSVSVGVALYQLSNL